MMEKLLEQGHAFFDLPQERKEEISIFKSMDRVRGYQRIGENVTYGKRDQQEVGKQLGQILAFMNTDEPTSSLGDRHLPRAGEPEFR
jgi:isopenicillin N synthase-like dioxygenase